MATTETMINVLNTIRANARSYISGKSAAGNTGQYNSGGKSPA